LDVGFAYEKYRNGGRGTNMKFYAGTDGVNWTAVPAGDQAFSPDPDTNVNNPPLSALKTVNLPGTNIALGIL
jgi:hypothetical protein